MIQKDEIKLTNDVVEILEWDLKYDEELKVNVYYCDFFPITINRCRVSNITTMFSHGKDDKLVYFRPMKNGKHCQFLVDYLYEHEDIDEILVSKDKDTKLYSGRIVMNDGEEYKLDNHYTETELKFALFYLYYFNEDRTSTIKRVHDLDEQQKLNRPMPTKKSNRK